MYRLTLKGLVIQAVNDMGQTHVPRILGQTHSNEVVTQHLPGHPHELYFKPRISEANPETELTTQKHLKTLRLIELRIEYALLYAY